MQNQQVARIFDTMADVMEIRGENAFRVNSYRKVARVLRDLPEDVALVHAEDRLTDVPGVGKSSAQKIAQFLETGRVEAYEKMMADFPEQALDLLRIPGLGPKTVGRLMAERGIESVDDLEKAIDTGALDGMSGIGEKTLQNMREGIEFLRRHAGRVLLGLALPRARDMAGRLAEACGPERVEVAGSARRMRETVGDLDLLTCAPADRGEEIVRAFTELEPGAEVLASGPTKGSLRTSDGLQVDLRVVEPDAFGAALVYFTGSKAHNVKLRGLAREEGLKVNEYGVFRDDERVAGRTEGDVYAALDLPWVPPEMREDRGEIEAAAGGDLPDLLKLDQVRADLHMHTNHSDGRLGVEDMARAARNFGYDYVALTDHSQSLLVASGLNVVDLRRRQEQIEAARRAMPDFPIFSGMEVDILPDGTMDYPDEVLAELDWVIASVHSHFNQSREEMTARICRAARHPRVHAIGHPTGRLIGQREAYEVDMTAVVEACAESGCALELNAHMNRLDITDVVCRQCREAGVMVTINTDAHAPEHFAMMAYGVGTARRGWLGAEHVLNCLPVGEFRDWLDQRGA
jgi:DNA polymerase (family 10)